MRVDWQQIVALFILAVPIACVARTVVFEEIFREPREYCREKSNVCRWFLTRKFFYLFTCEYCFSHYLVVFLTRLRLEYLSESLQPVARRDFTRKEGDRGEGEADRKA